MKYCPQTKHFPSALPSNQKNVQILYLNNQGYITDSIDTLFSTNVLQEKCVLNWSPFLDSIFHTLMDMPAQEITQFVRVTTVHPFLPGIYDYSFLKVPSKISNESILVWIISDRTECYEKMKAIQQTENEQTRSSWQA